MKRTLTLLLAVCMLIGLAPSFAAAANDDWTTLRVELFDRSTQGFSIEDNMQLRYIQESFGDPNHIKVEFVPVPRWSETEVLNTLLAGGTAPDICLTYDSSLIQQYINMGGLYPLDDLLAQYGQNLTALLGSVLRYGQNDVLDADGNRILDANGNKETVQLFIPALRTSVAKLGGVIRGDWLAQLGMDVPATVDEWVEYLYAAKAANLGGTVTVPYAMNLYPNAPLFATDLIVENFIDLAQTSREDWFCLYHNMLPGAKEGYRLLNKLYNDGLISENFAIDTSAEIRKSNMVQGNTGFYIEAPTQVWLAGDNFEKEMEKNVPGAYWEPVNCFQNADGYTLHPVYAANGIGIFVPSWVSEAVAKAAVMYLDWMSIQEHLFFLQHGVQGVNFMDMTEDGIAYNSKSGDDVPDEYKMSGDVCIILNGAYYGSDELNTKASSLYYTGYEELAELATQYSLTYGYAPVSFTVTINSEADYGQLVLAKQAEFLSNVLTCSPEDFDAVYERSSQAILDVGGAEIIAERKEAFANGEYLGDFPLDIIGK